MKQMLSFKKVKVELAQIKITSKTVGNTGAILSNIDTRYQYQ